MLIRKLYLNPLYGKFACHPAKVVDFIRPTWSITTPVEVKRGIFRDITLASGARTPGGAFRRAYCQHREMMDSRPVIRVFSEIRR